MNIYLLWTGIWPGMLLAMLIPAIVLWAMGRQGIWTVEILWQNVTLATIQGMTLLIVVMMIAGFVGQIMSNPNSGVGECAGKGGCPTVEVGP